jgi:uncharacterized protein
LSLPGGKNVPSAVVDTTVLISAFITPAGVAAAVIERGRRGDFGLCLSEDIIEELRSRLLSRSNIRRRYRYADEWVHQYCHDLEVASIQLVIDPLPISVVERDPNDDMVVACAVAAKADYLVTRDKDLLSLGSHEGIRMVTPRQFLDLLDAGA